MARLVASSLLRIWRFLSDCSGPGSVGLGVVVVCLPRPKAETKEDISSLHGSGLPVVASDGSGSSREKKKGFLGVGSVGSGFWGGLGEVMPQPRPRPWEEEEEEEEEGKKEKEGKRGEDG